VTPRNDVFHYFGRVPVGILTRNSWFSGPKYIKNHLLPLLGGPLDWSTLDSSGLSAPNIKRAETWRIGTNAYANAGAAAALRLGGGNSKGRLLYYQKFQLGMVMWELRNFLASRGPPVF
jgi:hypothetical protein